MTLRAAFQSCGVAGALAVLMGVTTDRLQPENAPEPARVVSSEAPVVDARLNDAVARGLAYLAAQQNDDGSFGQNTRYGHNVGITGLCGLAFISDGHMPDRGEYGDVVQATLDFVLEHANETGMIMAETSHGPMYGHGFATLFLGEIYGMGAAHDEPRLREALVKATELIVKTQNSEGGWRYNPVPEDADVSVTICQVMALRSARNAGIKVPKETIDRAVQYVRDCQNADGGFRYMLNQGASAWPRSAAGVATLYYAGVYDDDAIDRGIQYLHENAFPGVRRQQAHYYYGNYYASQAMFLAGGEHWGKWWPATRDDVLSRQDAPSGGWLDHHAGGPYATAMALIILQMPKQYLPIFQR
ncbi:MAG: prenyltransferase/squalene oxidase repeat-containing protein [Phycisphaerales bacterium]